LSAKRFGNYYKINGSALQYHYKNPLSDFKGWTQKEHAEDWLLYGYNRGKHLSLDETSLSNGELYTILTNKNGKGKKGCIVAIVKGTKANDVIEILDKIPLENEKAEKIGCCIFLNFMQSLNNKMKLINFGKKKFSR
jgi:hypothetical protein